jgi:hypothetical protein
MRNTPQAQTIRNAQQIMATTRHHSIRRAEGQAYEFVSIDGAPLVTRADARRLLNLGYIRMVRLTDVDGWEYVISNVSEYKHVGEHLAALATFDSVHRNPATRYRYGDYFPAPVHIPDKTVVSVWQVPGKEIQTTALPRSKKT